MNPLLKIILYPFYFLYNKHKLKKKQELINMHMKELEILEDNVIEPFGGKESYDQAMSTYYHKVVLPRVEVAEVNSKKVKVIYLSSFDKRKG